MPSVRMYIVTQEREVRVRAESPSDAVTLAAEQFKATTQVEGSIPRETRIEAREEY